MVKHIASLALGLSIGIASVAYASDNKAFFANSGPEIQLALHDDGTLTSPTSNKLSLRLPAETNSVQRPRPVNSRASSNNTANQHLQLAFNDSPQTPINVDPRLMALQLNVDGNTKLKIKLHSGYYFSVSKRW